MAISLVHTAFAFTRQRRYCMQLLYESFELGSTNTLLPQSTKKRKLSNRSDKTDWDNDGDENSFSTLHAIKQTTAKVK